MFVMAVKIFILAMGFYMLLGAVCNWNSLLTGIKEEHMAKLIGKTGVRIFYGIMGSLLIVIGIMMFFVDVDEIIKDIYLF